MTIFTGRLRILGPSKTPPVLRNTDRSGPGLGLTNHSFVLLSHIKVVFFPSEQQLVEIGGERETQQMCLVHSPSRHREPLLQVTHRQPAVTDAQLDLKRQHDVSKLEIRRRGRRLSSSSFVVVVFRCLSSSSFVVVFRRRLSS